MDERKITALHYSKERPMGPPGLHRATFWNRDRFDELLASRKADVPEKEWMQFIDFLARAPAKIEGRAARWERGNIPRSLDDIRSPVDEFVWRLQLFVKCTDKTQVPTVEEYAANEYNKLKFRGTIPYVDQARSTASAKGKGQEELDATVRVMHTYFLAAMGIFRFMRDTLVGDAISGVIPAPEDNPQVSAVEGARFLITLKALFEIHNKLVDTEEKTAGKSIYSRLKIRGSLATGDVSIMKNDIRSTIICERMNFAARLSGIPAEMELIVDGETARHIMPYFELKKVRVAGVVEDEIARLEKELSECGMPAAGEEKTSGGKEKLLKNIEIHFRLHQLYEIMYQVFELPNLDDEELRGESRIKMETPLRDKMEEHDAAFLKTIDDFDAVKLLGLDSGIKMIKRRAERDYSTEAYNKVRKLHLKGYGIDAFSDLYQLVGYKQFPNDVDSTPQGCKFRKIYLSGDALAEDGKARLEEFVDAVAAAYYISPKADFNPGVATYLMTTMQLTGSPDFAYQKACRAVGMTLHLLEGMRQDWGNQRNQLLQKAQEDLVKRGVFSESGELKQDGLANYLAESVVLPALLGEIGLLRLGCENGRDHGKVGDIGQWLGRDKASFTPAEEEIKKAVLNLHLESVKFLEEVNQRTKADHVYELFPERTLKVIGSLSYKDSWQDIAGKLDAADALAAEIVLTSGAIQSMRKLKAYKLNRGQKPVEWKAIMFELKKLNLHPTMVGMYSELFLENGAADPEKAGAAGEPGIAAAAA